MQECITRRLPVGSRRSQRRIFQSPRWQDNAAATLASVVSLTHHRLKRSSTLLLMNPPN